MIDKGEEDYKGIEMKSKSEEGLGLGYAQLEESLKKDRENDPVEERHEESSTTKLTHNHNLLNNVLKPLWFEQILKNHPFTTIRKYHSQKTNLKIVVKEYDLLYEEINLEYKKYLLDALKREFFVQSRLDCQKVLRAYSLEEEKGLKMDFGIYKLYFEYCPGGDLQVWRDYWS